MLHQIIVSSGNTPVAIEAHSLETIEKVAQLFSLRIQPPSQSLPENSWTLAIHATSRERPTAAGCEIEVEFGKTAEMWPTPLKLLYYYETGGLFEIDKANRRITIHNPSATGLIVDAYRSIRQITIAANVDEGRPCIHAAAVSKDGKGVAILGPKGAGKTTLSAALCAHFGWRQFANDKVFVAQGNTFDRFAESPGIVVNSIRLIPDFRTRWSEMLASRPIAPFTIFRDHPDLPSVRELDALPAQTKLYLTEQEYLSFLRTERDFSARLTAVIVLDTRRAGSATLAPSASAGYDQHVDDLDVFPDWLEIRDEKRLDFGPWEAAPAFVLSGSAAPHEAAAMVNELIART